MLAVRAAISAMPEDPFWDRFKHLEARQQALHSRHEQLQRSLDALSSAQLADDLSDTWKRYCEVIAELESAAEEFSMLRPHCA